MAQNISLLGATYNAVPAVLLPKSGGGTARFDDCSVVTAGASDVASGKVFVASDGTITTGTASGGGASNIVTGTFTTGSTTGTTETLDIPYTGSGYPMMMVIVVDGGAYNNSSTGNTDWYNSTQRYAIGQFTVTKARMDSAPGWATSGAANYGVVTVVYKNNASTATTYSRTSSMTANTFTASNQVANNTAATTVRFIGSGKKISYYVASSSYGLLANTKYWYHIVYSV